MCHVMAFFLCDPTSVKVNVDMVIEAPNNKQHIGRKTLNLGGYSLVSSFSLINQTH